MNLTDVADVIGIIRDVTLLLLLLVVLVVVVVIYKKVSSFLDAAKRTVDTAESVMSAVSSAVKPVAANSGFTFGVGKLVSFLVRRARGRQNEGRENG